MKTLHRIAFVLLVVAIPACSASQLQGQVNQDQITLMFTDLNGTPLNDIFSTTAAGMVIDVGGGIMAQVPWPINPGSTAWFVTGHWTDSSFQVDMYGNHLDNPPIGPDGNPLPVPADGWPSGFAALRACDDATIGGGDGRIDRDDACFRSLLLWFDRSPRNGLPDLNDNPFLSEIHQLPGDVFGGMCVTSVDLPNASELPTGGKMYSFGGPCLKGRLHFDRKCASTPATPIYECIFHTAPAP
jgi:hypothetical protein